MSNKSVNRRFEKHKWALDFSNRGKGDRQLTTPSADLATPLGYSDKHVKDPTNTDTSPAAALIVKKSWDIALGPLKQVPMNLFIMWMAGSSISIFPIMMVGMMFIRPIQALINIQQTFKMIEGDQAILQKAVYFLGNLVGVVLAVYKCQVMGLLPTHPSDWLAFVEPQKRMEWSGGGISL